MGILKCVSIECKKIVLEEIMQLYGMRALNCFIFAMMTD